MAKEPRRFSEHGGNFKPIIAVVSPDQGVSFDLITALFLQSLQQFIDQISNRKSSDFEDGAWIAK